MKFYRNLLLGLCIVAPLASNADVKSTSPDGYLSRGMAMYNVHNYVGAIDQLTQLTKVTTDARLIDNAEFYIALSRYERDEQRCISELRDYIAKHPSSVNADKAWATIGDYYFFHGKYGDAVRHYDKVNIGALDADAQEDVYYRRAFSLLCLGEYKSAKTDINALSGSTRYADAGTFYQGYIDYANGNYDEALNKFNRVRRGGELGYNAQYYQCQIYFTQEEYDKTENLAKSLLGDGQNAYFNNELSRIIGECEYHNGNDDEAAPYLKTYLDNAQGDPIRSAAYTYGVIEHRNGNYQGAIESLGNVTSESDAMTQSAYLYIGQSYLALKEMNSASMAFEKAIQLDYDKDVTETAFYNYAVAQNEGGRTPFNKSIDIYEQFINTYPNSRYSSKVEEYLINAYMTTNDYDKAIASINHIKKPSAKVLAAKQYVLYHLGAQELSNGNTNVAKKYFTESLNYENQNKAIGTETRLWLGECAYRNGDYSSAQKYQTAFLNAAAASNENIGLGNYNLGYSLFQQRKYADARTSFGKAIASKNLSTALKADAYNRIGDCNYYTRQYSAAVENYDEAYRLDKTTAGDYALYQKAVVQGLSKDHNAKIATINSLLKQYPSSNLAPSALLDKANTYALIGNNKAAEEAYNELLSTYPTTAEARKGLLQLAINERNMGQETKAITTYKQVISKYPTSEEAAVAAEDLKLVYADRGSLNEYADFLNNVPNAPKMDVKEVEKLTYNAAEKAALAEKSDISKMQKYLADYPNGAYVPNANYYIGRNEYQNAKYSAALANINKALDAAGDATFSEDALAIKSEILMRQGKNTDALSTYRQLEAKSSSQDTKIIANLGIMRASKELKQWNEVKTSAANLIGIGGLTAAEERETILNRAIANANLGNTKEAETDYSKLAKDVRNESGAQAAYELANLQYKAGNYKTCEKTLNKFIDEGTPHQYWLAKAFILLADTYHKQGQSFEAIEYLESLKSNYPGKDDDIFREIDSRLNSWKAKKK